MSALSGTAGPQPTHPDLALGEFEIELKLTLPAKHAERLKRHAALKHISPHRAVIAELDAVYFDTPELVLQAHGIAVRLRNASGSWVQTVKTRGDATGGLHQRPEWEIPSNGRDLTFSHVSDEHVRALLETPDIRSRLVPIFRTRFRRWARLLVLHDGTRIELALDQGEICTDHETAPISEIELELKAGHPSALFDLALQLAPDLALFPEQRSKAERGYQLHTGRVSAPQRMQLPALKGSLSTEQACWAFVASALTTLQANIPGARRGADPEFLHQVRVAVRRLRTTLSLFRSSLAGDDLIALQSGLRVLMRALGPAREWDVLVTETLPAATSGRADSAGMAWLRHAAQQQREGVQAHAASVLASNDTAQLLIRLGALLCRLHFGPQRLTSSIDTARPPTSRNAPRLRAFARRALRRSGRHAMLDASQLAALDAEGRHGWRIALKKLRYASDFFAPLLVGTRDSRRWIAALSSLQDILGILNDAETTHALLASLQAIASERDAAGAGNCDATAAIAWVAGYAEGMAEAGLKQLPPLRKKLQNFAAPWK